MATLTLFTWIACVPASGGGTGPDADSDADADVDADSDADTDADSDVDTDADPCAAPDGDGDGHGRIECGGDDCDDLDAAVHPGAEDGVRSIETVARGYHGPSIALDADDVVHILCDHSFSYPMHTWKDGADWQTEDLGDPADGGGPLVFADGALHAVLGGQMLHYATRGAAGWTLETVGYYASYTAAALAVDDGVAQVAYEVAYFPAYYATDEGGDWASETIGGAEIDWGWPAIAVAPDGVVHVLYGAYELRHVAGELGSWETETVPDAGRGDQSSLAIGDDGTLHVATADQGSYDDRTDDRVVYATLPPGGEWSVEDVDADMYWEGFRFGVSLALDPVGRPQVAYHDATHSDLVYATRSEDGVWTRTVAVGDGDTGYDPALAIDSDGVAHVAFDDDGSGEVRLVSFRADGVDDDCDGVADEG
jgi:hypothetical protein